VYKIVVVLQAAIPANKGRMGVKFVRRRHGRKGKVIIQAKIGLPEADSVAEHGVTIQ
jgi:hypothetical protein